MFIAVSFVQWKICIGCFLVQVFFNPEIHGGDFTTTLPEVIDKCIQSAPIDTRRALYKVT